MFLSVGISSWESFFNLLGIIVIFLLILALSYLTARWLGGSKALQQWNRNISVVESYRLGQNKLIQIVKVGGRYLAIGVGKDSIEFLAEIPEEELSLDAPKEQGRAGTMRRGARLWGKPGPSGEPDPSGGKGPSGKPDSSGGKGPSGKSDPSGGSNPSGKLDPSGESDLSAESDPSGPRETAGEERAEKGARAKESFQEIFSKLHNRR